VGWSLSFDNIFRRFEYVRHGADWSQLLHNLDLVQDLMRDGGHWGGIHAVYNIYNATRLQEFTEFARDRGLTIHWQSLYQPDCLDPARLGPDIAAQARAEIEALIQRDICLESELDFFRRVLQGVDRDDLRGQLREHIEEIEQRYHTDKQGCFELLWPEIWRHL
jgi:hypothetical protein